MLKKPPLYRGKKMPDPYGCTGEGIHELQSAPEAGLSLERYEELIRKENVLAILCRMIALEKPFGEDRYRAVAGEYFPIVGGKEG